MRRNWRSSRSSYAISSRSDDKRRARLNCISHILDVIPYKRVRRNKVKLPKRSTKGRYNDQIGLRGMKFVAERY
jgi:polyphosphate kinase